MSYTGEAHLNPFYSLNDYVAAEEWSRTIVRGHYVHLIARYVQHKCLSEVWDKNLRLQGFVEAFDPRKHIRG